MDLVFPPALYQQPKQGWGDVSSHLHNMAITTFDVDPKKLASLLPPECTPETVVLSDGRERALVSSVSFINRNFFVRFAPFIQLDCHQTNYRAYVRYRGKSVVWFFHTTLESFWTFVPRYVWGLPWLRSSNHSAFVWEEGNCRSYQWQGKSAKGHECLRVKGSGQKTGILDGFSDAESCWELLTHPFDGYLYLRNRHVAHYSVWHAPLEMERGIPEEVRFGIWEDLGLVNAGQEPHSILLQEKIHYLIFLPPRCL